MAGQDLHSEGERVVDVLHELRFVCGVHLRPSSGRGAGGEATGGFRGRCVYL